MIYAYIYFFFSKNFFFICNDLYFFLFVRGNLTSLICRYEYQQLYVGLKEDIRRLLVLFPAGVKRKLAKVPLIKSLRNTVSNLQKEMRRTFVFVLSMGGNVQFILFYYFIFFIHSVPKSPVSKGLTYLSTVQESIILYIIINRCCCQEIYFFTYLFIVARCLQTVSA